MKTSFKALVIYSIVITFISCFLIAELKEMTYELQEKEEEILQSSAIIDSLMNEQHYFIKYMNIQRNDNNIR